MTFTKWLVWAVPRSLFCSLVGSVNMVNIRTSSRSWKHFFSFSTSSTRDASWKFLLSWCVVFLLMDVVLLHIGQIICSLSSKLTMQDLQNVWLHRRRRGSWNVSRQIEHLRWALLILSKRTSTVTSDMLGSLAMEPHCAGISLLMCLLLLRKQHRNPNHFCEYKGSACIYVRKTMR